MDIYAITMETGGLQLTFWCCAVHWLSFCGKDQMYISCNHEGLSTCPLLDTEQKCLLTAEVGQLQYICQHIQTAGMGLEWLAALLATRLRNSAFEHTSHWLQNSCKN